MRGGVGETRQSRGQRADDVEHDQGRMCHGGIDSHGTARQRQGDGRPHHDAPAVHGVADGSRPERAGDEWDQLRQADGADLQRRPRHGVDLERDGDDGQLIPERGDQLAREQEPEVAALAQRGGVHEDPARHGAAYGWRRGPEFRHGLFRRAADPGRVPRCPMRRANPSSAARRRSRRRRTPRSRRRTRHQARAGTPRGQRSPRAGQAGRPGWAACRATEPCAASARMPATIGVSIMPGAMALSRSPEPAHAEPVAWRRTQCASANLVAGYATSEPRASAICSAPCRVAVQARLDEVGGDGRLHRGRVGADGDSRAALDEERPQALEYLDGAEVVHGGHQRARPVGRSGQACAGHDAGQRPAAALGCLGDGPAPALGGGEVGHHVGLVLVDPDDSPARRRRDARRWRRRCPTRPR